MLPLGGIFELSTGELFCIMHLQPAFILICYYLIVSHILP